MTDPTLDPVPAPEAPEATSASEPAPAAKPKRARTPKAGSPARLAPEASAKPERVRVRKVSPAAEVPAEVAAHDEAPAADGLPRRKRKVDRDAAKERPSIDVARRIVELAEDKKAAEIVLLDLKPLTTMADYFVICSGGSERQLGAIADGIILGMRDEGIRTIGREGTSASHWVLVDFGDVIVHIFTPPERDYYSLERHWSEAKTILRVE